MITILQKIKPTKRLMAVEWAGIIYCILTAILVIILYGKMEHPQKLLQDRMFILLGTFVLYLIHLYYPSRLTIFLRIAGQLGLLAYWYPDTFEFNRLFNNLDPLFANMDRTLFHCQPSLVFSQLFPSLWVSEAFNFGYFCYYPLIALVIIYYFLFCYQDFEKITFILISSFFIYYLVYIAIPVTGPQFYFRAVGVDKINADIYPWLGRYFDTNDYLITGMKFDGGFFYRLVEASQEVGERPTAAFPSSHVGISTIIMILAWLVNRSMALILLPIYILLCGATVYIQAHYLIDSIAGFLSGIGLFFLTAWIWDQYEAIRQDTATKSD